MEENRSVEYYDDLKNILINDDTAENLFFYGSVNNFEIFIRTADKSVGVIQSADSVRLIVLETWLLLDYSIRSLLLSILDLNQLNHQDYDLAEFLLPQSISDCVDLIYRIKEVNLKLPEDTNDNTIRLRGKFLLYLQKKEPEFFTQFLRIEDEYYSIYYPELSKTYQESLTAKGYFPVTSSLKDYKRISNDKLSFISRIDQEWIKKAKKLHSARNLAAHSYDENRIAERMGYSGPNLIEHTRTECLSTIETLLGIKQRNAA